MSDFKLHILGCGSATPSMRHLPACQVIDYRGNLMMIDCGEGAQLSMRRMGLKFSRLNHVFLSHLHGDHCLGLPGLLSTLALHQKGGTVTVHTSADGAEILSRIMDFFCRERTYSLEFNILDPSKRQVALETNALTVEAFPLRHRVPCRGFLFREKEKPRHLRGDMAKFYQIPVSQLKAIKDGADYVTPEGTIVANDRLTTPADHAASYAYCSDTVYMPSLAETVKKVDLLYHEATYADDATAKAHERFHSTASEAARTALAAEAGQLLLGHFSKAYNDESQHLAQARAIFPATEAAREGRV
ncbi:MAG: ribonuclease Z, partial [Muribaculaceae bacterium]|nr:ribonuclease Z [Muribaculaceae bacterium]